MLQQGRRPGERGRHQSGGARASGRVDVLAGPGHRRGRISNNPGKHGWLEGLPHSVLEVTGRRRRWLFPPLVVKTKRAAGPSRRGGASMLPAGVAPGEDAVVATAAPLLRPCKSGRLDAPPQVGKEPAEASARARWMQHSARQGVMTVMACAPISSSSYEQTKKAETIEGMKNLTNPYLFFPVLFFCSSILMVVKPSS